MTTRALPSRRGRAWDEASIRRELTAFVVGRTTWPTYREFIAGGAKGLREAISRIRGESYWAQEMGLADTQRPRGGIVRWTEETVEAALRPLLAGRDTWPTRTEFAAAGLRGLGEVLREREEAPMWAARMGVAAPDQIRKLAKKRPRPQKSVPATKPWPRWTEETVASALGEFLAGREDWPKHSEFVEAGRKGLYHAILKHGGSRAWAVRMGVRWVARTRRHDPWTEAELRVELRTFLSGASAWPTGQQFAEAGRHDLLKAARSLGGTEKWRREFSLTNDDRTRPTPSAALRNRTSDDTQPRRSAPPFLWTDERIEAAITPLIQTLGRWPTKAEFRRAGQSRALSAVYDHGGSGRWQQHFGVHPKPLAGPVPDRTRWPQQRIEAELRALIARCGHWPTEREFAEYGPVGLYSALVRRGGARQWRQRLASDPPDSVAG